MWAETGLDGSVWPDVAGKQNPSSNRDHLDGFRNLKQVFSVENCIPDGIFYFGSSSKPWERKLGQGKGRRLRLPNGLIWAAGSTDSDVKKTRKIVKILFSDP